MVFVPPTWFEGLLFHIGITVIPIIILLVLLAIGLFKESNLFIIPFVLLIICLCAAPFTCGVLWHDIYEVPSVQEKVITVQEWQPKVGIESYDGMMHIDGADDLMLVTTDDECFFNEENFLFQKFDTRDVFNTLKEGGTYKIKYYGWREPFNSGFPNLLSVEEVVDESNVTNKHYSDYFGTKLIN